MRYLTRERRDIIKRNTFENYKEKKFSQYLLILYRCVYRIGYLGKMRKLLFNLILIICTSTIFLFTYNNYFY